ncbi:Bug family tripartite tricarboxylate transporter substrate binding protein [Imbroritus primus]|uniref:Bug family tripartite tricarboxylate transporter substrate binding protein n=1 Tax=Imbroritus primus TaxID=3058603 RepID=UPI003D160C88
MKQQYKLLAATLLSAATFNVAADPAYPSRPITLIVPFGAGGAFDVVARMTAKQVGEELKQSVVVENKPGAGGTLGGKLVANAKADGYTLLFSGTGPISIAPAVYKNLGYSPAKALAPVVQLTSSPLILAASDKFQGKTVQDFVAQLKASPGKYNYASSGNGTIVHLAGEYFKTQTKTDAVHIPFGGGAQVATSLLAGETLFSITNIPNVRSHIEAGKLRGLATTAAKRSSAFPNLPTMRESGYPQFDLTGWIGIFAPAGTPAAIVEKLNAAYVKAMQDPELKKRLVEQGDEVATGSVAAFTSFVAKSDEQWSKIATSANVKID